MESAHRAAVAGVIMVLSAVAHAESSGTLDWRSRLAQAPPPNPAASPEPAAPSEPATPPLPALPPETPSSMEVPRQGDRWVYDLKDEISGEVKGGITQIVTEASDKEIVVRVTSPGQPNSGIIVFDRNWGVLESGLWKHSPTNCLGIVVPLKPGKEWHCTSLSKNTKTGTTYRSDVQAKVIGKENVTTAAGTFDTFRIGYALKMISTELPNRSSNFTLDILYAPAINHWVKRHERLYLGRRLQKDDTAEVTQYARKP